MIKRMTVCTSAQGQQLNKTREPINRASSKKWQLEEGDKKMIEEWKSVSKWRKEWSRNRVGSEINPWVRRAVVEAKGEIDRKLSMNVSGRGNAWKPSVVPLRGVSVLQSNFLSDEIWNLQLLAYVSFRLYILQECYERGEKVWKERKRYKKADKEVTR